MQSPAPVYHDHLCLQVLMSVPVYLQSDDGDRALSEHSPRSGLRMMYSQKMKQVKDCMQSIHLSFIATFLSHGPSIPKCMSPLALASRHKQ